jgi:hypothetical protein
MRIKVYEENVHAWEGEEEQNLPSNWREVIGREGRHEHEWNVRRFMEDMDGTVPPRTSFVRKVRDCYAANGIVAVYRYEHWCGCWVERTRTGEIWDQQPCCTPEDAGDTRFATPLIASLAKR